MSTVPMNVVPTRARELDARSLYLRHLVVDALASAGFGHVGPSMSLIEILRVLYDSFLNYRSDEPRWPDRDRLILSKGHGCLALYALLVDKGFVGREALSEFCSATGILGGHPEYGKIPGVEASTGALGHGLPVGVGMAIAARMRNQSHRVVVVVGDGELGEGSNWEAALTCAKHELSNLTLMIDANGLQIFGPVERVLGLEPLASKLSSFGFAVAEVDGHDVGRMAELLQRLPLVPRKPSAIICRTIKGKGIPFAENNTAWHYRFELAKQDVVAMRLALSAAGDRRDCANERSES